MTLLLVKTPLCRHLVAKSIINATSVGPSRKSNSLNSLKQAWNSFWEVSSCLQGFQDKINKFRENSLTFCWCIFGPLQSEKMCCVLLRQGWRTKPSLPWHSTSDWSFCFHWYHCPMYPCTWSRLAEDYNPVFGARGPCIANATFQSWLEAQASLSNQWVHSAICLPVVRCWSHNIPIGWMFGYKAL